MEFEDAIYHPEKVLENNSRKRESHHDMNGHRI